MRLIGNVADKTQAERFASFLLTRNIETQCEEAADHWDVWVRDEDKIDVAREELEKFRASPDAKPYLDAVEAANLMIRQRIRQERKVRKQQVDMTGGRWNAPIHKLAPLTVTLIVICFLVSLATNFGYDQGGFAIRALSLCSLSPAQALEVDARVIDPYSIPLRMYSLTHFELWRAVTPVFIHFGGWHLVFNMYWLVFFGRQIEARYGSWWMFWLVLFTAVPATVIGGLMPESLDGTPIVAVGNHLVILAGGMSGVIYGLFGYVLVKMLFDERCGLSISTGGAIAMIVWLFACMTPAFQELMNMNVDNWAHGVGIVAGAAIGYGPKLLADLGWSGKSAD